MATETTPLSSRRIVFAGLVGNVMEWYDFAVYGYFAVVIGQHFFPAEDPAVSLIAAFGAKASPFSIFSPSGVISTALVFVRIEAPKRPSSASTDHREEAPISCPGTRPHDRL